MDYRRRVVEYVAEGGSKAEAARLFKISRDTLYKWLAAGAAALTPKPKQERCRKIDKAALVKDVQEHPDDFLHERAKRFGVTGPAIWYALSAMKILKKTASVHGARRYEKNGVRRSVAGKRKSLRP